MPDKYMECRLTTYLALQKTNIWGYNEIREEFEALIEGLGTEVAQNVVFDL
jgi:hypothetical protein